MKLINYIFIYLISLSVGSAEIVGEIEKIGIPQINYITDARIDSGAKTTSILGTDLKEKKSVNGKNNLSFCIKVNGKFKEITAPIIKKIKVKSAVSANKDERYIVELPICFGTKMKTIRATVANRSKMEYKILIGRNLLLDGYLVDVSKKYLLGEPSCK
ncbi:MAG: ATP-dependent zinc protease [Bacteriovoracales bacterium]